MDGIALELWNKNLLLCRHKRKLNFNSVLELSYTRGLLNSATAATLLYKNAAENLEVLMLQWQEIFQGSWRRQNPGDPIQAAENAEHELIPILMTEQRQIENEIARIGADKGLEWTDDNLREGKTLLSEQVSFLQAASLTRIADLKAARDAELRSEKLRRADRRKEFFKTRAVGGLLILAGVLAGVRYGAQLTARQSEKEKAYLEEKLKTHRESTREAQRRLQEELGELRKSNRKIAFWTEKTPQQIDKEMEDVEQALAAQIRDIREQSAGNIARVESEYARSGREGGAELEMRKQGLMKVQAKLIEAAEAKAQRKLDDLENQKRNIMR